MSDKDADERDEDALSSEVLGTDGDSDGGDDELRDGHSEGSVEEEKATSIAVDSPDSWQCHDNVDDVCNYRDDEGVADATVLEEGGAVVEDEVDTWRFVSVARAKTETRDRSDDLPVSC